MPSIVSGIRERAKEMTLAKVFAMHKAPEGEATAADIGSFATGGVEIMFGETGAI